MKQNENYKVISISLRSRDLQNGRGRQERITPYSYQEQKEALLHCWAVPVRPLFSHGVTFAGGTAMVLPLSALMVAVCGQVRPASLATSSSYWCTTAGHFLGCICSIYCLFLGSPISGTHTKEPEGERKSWSYLFIHSLWPQSCFSPNKATRIQNLALQSKKGSWLAKGPLLGRCFISVT